VVYYAMQVILNSRSMLNQKGNLNIASLSCKFLLDLISQHFDLIYSNDRVLAVIGR